MFINLYNLPGRSFLDHNFSDYLNCGIGNDPIRKVKNGEIHEIIAKSFEPHPNDKTKKCIGLPRKFDSILKMTFSMACCDSFIRANPSLPITPRDYYLSKLFQFLAVMWITRFEDDFIGEQLFRLHQVLDRVSIDDLPPGDRIKLEELWWESYHHCLALGSAADVLDQFEAYLTSQLDPLEPASTKRRRGPRADMARHRKIAGVVESWRLRKEDWRDDLPGVCAELDRLGLSVSDYKRGELKDGWKKVNWETKLATADGHESVSHAIRNSLKKADNRSKSDR